MFILEDFKNFYKGYGQKINEAAPAVISDDPKERLKGYLENDALLTELSKQFKNIKDGEVATLTNLNKDTFGIMKDDNLVVRIDKKDPNTPKYYMWIENEKTLYGDIDFEIAANIVKDAMKGMGTNNDKVAGVAGIFIKIAADRNVDPKKYFDKLSEAFSKIGEGNSLKDWLEDDFSGRSEVCALNAYQLPIEASAWRGFTDNWLTIVGDVALGVLTLGGSYAFEGVVKAGSGLVKTGEALKGARGIFQGGKVTRTVGQGVELLGKGLELLAPAKKAFSELPLVDKLKGVEKAGYTAGSEWISSKGTTHVIQSIDKSTGKILLKSNSTGKVWSSTVDAFMSLANIEASKKILTASGIAISAGTVAGTALTQGVASTTSTNKDLEFQGNWLEDTGEFLGYYDAMAADPNKFINSLSKSSDQIAQSLKDYKEGTGFFGNTTDQEELAIVLTIMNLNRATAKLVSERYKKLTGSSVANLINDELEGGMAEFASAHWYALTGEGDGDGASKVKDLYSRFVSTSPATI